MVSTNKGSYSRVAMACQGGGSLGAYHIGALRAMQEAGYSPDTIAGISIGAFTAALIAGNTPQTRIAKLEKFWDTISWPDIPPMSNLTDEIKKFHNTLTSLQGFLFGQPNFFSPRFPIPQMQPKGTAASTSYYDTSKLKETLLQFVDFDGINSGKLGRLILGATRVKDGQLIFFDSAKMKIGPEHVMASGSMPPGFPGMVIDGDLYWDGGCASNTPLEGIFDADPKVDTLCFMVDLFAANGKEPQDMDEVTIKLKELQFASRTAHHIEHLSKRHNLSRYLQHLMDALPADLQKDPIMKEIQDFSNDTKFDIVHIAYDKPKYEVSSSDCEFSKMSIKDRATYGYQHMKAAIEHSPWLKEREAHIGSTIHKFVGTKHLSSS
ncbi:MAG: patatin-like phospholipase family protein [Candidatus Paracaedimonas acanthamoebae]|uniref:Patatin-like phospholipase family protein n=1 Tax=Candidatus Paracaedimonas acanthamoebae TaxID=244581 RepID=A0A8J7TTA9_9PROT|nr:patatin-like phospholipase family protein [Candidatus Paracaedimonas acanthamoebae]